MGLNLHMKVNEFWDLELDFIEYEAARIILVGEGGDETIRVEVTDAKGHIMRPYLNTDYIIQAAPSSAKSIQFIWGGKENQNSTIRKIKLEPTPPEIA